MSPQALLLLSIPSAAAQMEIIRREVELALDEIDYLVPQGDTVREFAALAHGLAASHVVEATALRRIHQVCECALN